MSLHDPSAPFNAIVGATLVAVTFVWDYVQLQFEAVELAGAAQLTAHTLPTVELAARCWTSGDDGWRNALCARIGAIVRKAWCSEQRLQLDFEDGAAFTISWRDEDYVPTGGLHAVCSGPALGRPVSALVQKPTLHTLRRALTCK